MRFGCRGADACCRDYDAGVAAPLPAGVHAISLFSRRERARGFASCADDEAFADLEPLALPAAALTTVSAGLAVRPSAGCCGRRDTYVRPDAAHGDLKLTAIPRSRCCKDDHRIDMCTQRRRLAGTDHGRQEDRREDDAVCNPGAEDDRAAAEIGTSFADQEAVCPTTVRRTRERVTGAMTYLHCPRCRLAINSRAPYLTMTQCPRCLARAAIRTPLFASALNGHELRARQPRRVGDIGQASPRLEALLPQRYARDIPPRVP